MENQTNNNHLFFKGELEYLHFANDIFYCHNAERLLLPNSKINPSLLNAHDATDLH